MISAKCEQCGLDTSYPDVYGGQRLKCKNCPDGQVEMPAREGFVTGPAPPAMAAVAQSAPITTTAPVIAPPTPPHDTYALPVTDYAAYDRPEPEAGTSFVTSILWTLAVLGLGSVVLGAFDLQFRKLAFLEPLQPFAGLAMGLGGAGGLVWWYRRGKRF